MRIYEKDPRCWLAELSDLEREPMPERVRENLGTLRAIVEWAKGYLAQPHPELGRSGPVCPFVRPAMARGTIFFAVWPGARLDADEVESVVRSYRDWFLELEPAQGREAQYKSINILFPDIPTSEVGRLIDGTQERLKPVYVRDGIMIGEFHPGPPKKAGLWNEDFRPLKSPIPLLSIRHMVATDFAFLRDRREFMEAYLSAFAERVPSALSEHVHDTAFRFGLLPGADEVESAAAHDVQARAVRDAHAVARAVAEAAQATLCADAAAASAAGCPHHASRAQDPAAAACPVAPEAAVERIAVERIVSEPAAHVGA
ncbi:MAG: hypothetical protein KY467_01635 [Gemmatimonadetes bacterium]|nr:hypothetical protein [Gemmatimonadota bacterium]